jgi:hypothetical protein
VIWSNWLKRAHVAGFTHDSSRFYLGAEDQSTLALLHTFERRRRAGAAALNQWWSTTDGANAIATGPSGASRDAVILGSALSISAWPISPRLQCAQRCPRRDYDHHLIFAYTPLKWWHLQHCARCGPRCIAADDRLGGGAGHVERGRVDAFAILFFGSYRIFFAIAWMYREIMPAPVSK